MSLPRLLTNKLFGRKVTLPAPREESLEAALLLIDPTHTVLFTCDKFQTVQQKRPVPPPLPTDARATRWTPAGTPYLLRPGLRLRLSAWWHDAGIVLRSRLDAIWRAIVTVWAVVRAKVMGLRHVDLRGRWRAVRERAAMITRAARLKRDELRIRYGRRFGGIRTL